jgi:hypothetical protein
MINNLVQLRTIFFIFLCFLFISCSEDSELEKKVELKDNINTKYKTNLLIEDYTGAWCGWCPRVAYKIDDLWKITEKRISIVAIHNQDAFSFEKEKEMRDKYWESGYGFPTVMINRNKKWNEQYKVITDQIAISSPLGLALESSLKDRKLSLKIKVGFGYDFSSLKLVVYLTENGLIANQANYAELGYGTANPLQDFVHDNVLRVSLSDVFGDVIDSSISKNGEFYEKSYNYLIPNAYSLDSNIVAFVVDGSDRAVNSRFFSTTGNEIENAKFQLAN